MTKALELAKFGRETPPTGVVVGDSDAQTLSSKTFSDGPVFSGLNANGVPFLNASKVLSSSSTFVFDGTNIGLGIASPAATLHVNASGGGTIRASRSTVGGEYIQLDHDGTDGTLRVSGNNKLYLATNGTTRLTILGGGFVGVGIQAPSAVLHTQSSGLGDGGGIKLTNSGSGGGTFAIWPTATINGEGANKLIFSGSGGNLVTLTGTGNLGIGTTSPAQTLDVRGTTTATIRIGSTGHGVGSDDFANLEFYWGDPDAAEVKAKIYTKNVGNIGPGGGGAADLLFATTPAGGSLTQAFRITSAGQVIVGSGSTADRPFHLVGSGTRQYIKAETTTNNISNEAGFDIKTPNSNFIIGSHGSTNALWIYDMNAAAERLRIDSAGILILGNNIVNTGGGRFDLTSNGTSTIQARSSSIGTGDGTTDVTVTRAVSSLGSWWAHARYDAFSHTWGYGGSASANVAMRLTGNGNLAIGTTSNVSEKLNINGSAWFLANNDANYSTIIVPRYDSTWSFSMQTRLNSTSFSEWLGIYSDAGGSNPRLALAPNGWNVGIGTTTPWARFQVTRSVNNTNTAATNMSDYQGAAIILHNQDDAGTGNKAGLFFAFAGAPGLLSGIDGYKESGNWNTGLRFYTNNQTGGASTGTLYERMRIAPNGRVTIPYAGGSDSDPGFIVTCGSAANTFNWAASFLNPNLTAGKNISVFVGHTTNGGNAGYIGFNYQGSNAAANALTLGLHSNDNILNIRNDGAVIIGGLNPQAGTPKFGVIGATNQQYVTQLAWNYNNSEANWAGANALFIKNTYGVDGNTTQASIGFAVTNSGGDHHRASIHGYGVNGGSYGGLKFYTRGPNESIPRYTLNQNGVEINSNVTTWIGMYTRVYRYSFSGSAPGNMQTFSIGTLVNYDNTYCVATVKIRSPLVYATAGSNLGYWEGQATVRRANNGTAWVTVNSTVHAVDAANAVNDPIVYWSGDTCYMDVPTYVGVTAQIEVIVWAGEFTANNY